jgi:hypothetical protein
MELDLSMPFERRLAWNLQVLQRVDPAVQRIVASASFVSVYEFQSEAAKWKKLDCEGCLFVVRRNAAPVFRLVVLNKMCPEDHVTELGDVEVNDVSADLQVHNASRATNMLLELRVSLTGTATPQVPFAFTEVNRPSYFANSVAVLGPKTYAGGSTTPEHIEGAALIPAIGTPRLWLIVSNTVTSVGLGDSLSSLQANLNQVVLHAVVTKSLAGAGGGLETTGL